MVVPDETYEFAMQAIITKIGGDVRNWRKEQMKVTDTGGTEKRTYDTTEVTLYVSESDKFKLEGTGAIVFDRVKIEGYTPNEREAIQFYRGDTLVDEYSLKMCHERGLKIPIGIRAATEWKIRLSLMHKFRIVYEYTGGTESPVWDGLQIKIKSERTAGQTVLFYKLGAADPGATTSDSEFELYAPFVAEDGDEIEFAVFLASTGDRTTNKFTIYSEKEIQAILVA